MDMRWWVWIALALFAGLLGYLWATTGKAPPLEATVLSLSEITEERATLARVPGGQLEYRRVPGRLLSHYHQDSHTVSHVLAGQATGFLYRSSIELEPGDLFIVPRQTALGLRTISAEPLELLTFYTPLPSPHDEVQVVIADLLPPGDPNSLMPEAMPPYEVQGEDAPRLLALTAWDKLSLIYNNKTGWEWSYLSRTRREGSVALVRVSERATLSERGVHFLYLVRGAAKITVPDKTLEAEQGQIVLLPEGAPRTIESIGAERLEFLLFSPLGLREKDLF
jgi:mannose-6-phosphate isomerase-like protein (cupin superfamily)